MLRADLVHLAPHASPRLVPGPCAWAAKHKINRQSVLVIGLPRLGIGDDASRTGASLRIKISLPLRASEGFENEQRDLGFLQVREDRLDGLAHDWMQKRKIRTASGQRRRNMGHVQ